MYKSELLDRYCSLDRTSCEKEVLSFSELMQMFNKFEINSKKVGDELLSRGSVVNDTQEKKFKVIYDGRVEYYVDPNLRDIIDLCLWVLADGKLLECSDTHDSKLFEYMRDSIPGLFGYESECRKYFTSVLVIPDDFDIDNQDCLSYIDKIFWGSIDKVVIPGSVDVETLVNILEDRKISVQYKAKINIAFLSKDLKEEIDMVGGMSKVYDINNLYEHFQDELDLLYESLIRFNAIDSSTLYTGSDSLKVIENRYALAVKLYDYLDKDTKNFNYILIRLENNNPLILTLIGSLCAVLCYFNSKKPIVDLDSAIANHFQDMVIQVTRGDILSPYNSLRRLTKISEAIEQSLPSIYKSVLRKGDRRNPVNSLPLGLVNREQCYLFPLTMFLSYIGDKKLRCSTGSDDLKILSLPKDKDIPLVISECTLDNITVHEGVKLKLSDSEYSTTKLFNGKMIEHIKDTSDGTLLEDIKFKKDYVSDIFAHIGSNDIGFEGSGAKLTLHDWILNPTLSSLEVVENYLHNIIKAPNLNVNLEEDFSTLLHKILGFSNEEEYSEVFRCVEWDDGLTAKTSVVNGVAISKSSFKSINYAKSEFYQAICEMITSVLASEGINRYVTIHDILLGTMEIDGSTQLYIFYCPVNPEVIWLSSENGEFESYEDSESNKILSIEKDWLCGIPDSMLIEYKSELLGRVYENSFMLSEFDTSDFDNLKKNTDSSVLDRYLTLNAKFRLLSDETLSDITLNDNISEEVQTQLIEKISESPNILDVSFIPNDAIDNYKKSCIWFIVTKFIGFNCNIPTLFELEEKTVGSQEYGLTVMQYLYSDYYNIIGSEHLEELATIVSPDKHLKYARVINPFGGVLRDRSILSLPDKEKVFCTTNGPGISRKYQYINSRFV